jgi:transcriptional regulator with XRE-family HTH domain
MSLEQELDSSSAAGELSYLPVPSRLYREIQARDYARFGTDSAMTPFRTRRPIAQSTRPQHPRKPSSTSLTDGLGTYQFNRELCLASKQTPSEGEIPAASILSHGLTCFIIRFVSGAQVAQRAHVSATWYTWLEQGRGGSPSAEVLDRIARALMLTNVEREHLFFIALGHPPFIIRPHRRM